MMDSEMVQRSPINLAQKGSIIPSTARSIYSTSRVAGLMKEACRWLVGGYANPGNSLTGATL